MNSKIFEIKQKIQALEIEKEKLLQELKRLENSDTNDTNQIASNFNISNSTQLTPIEKIKLFRSLFIGRNDVFARKWTNKDGKSGYSPAKNYNGKYLELTDEIIKYHLQGINPKEKTYYNKKRDYIIGIYPMLKNEKCNFLAIDFDAKHSNNDYQSEVLAFINTCEKLNIPAYIEISQSGQGSHVWIFFENEISASLARRLGTLLLNIAMEENPEISFKTYDRLFPNQDTMPKGGFGNLIALPLQQKARQENKTVFVDKNFCPFTNQWEFLSQIKKISETEINTILNAHKHFELKNNFYGENNETPWKLPQKENFSNIILPDKITLILSNKIYIEKENLPPKLTNKFLKIAAFQNPEFYKAEAMRFSTYDKPRIIACGEILEKFIALPRGCLQEILKTLKNLNIETEIQDERVFGKKIKITFKGILQKEQKVAYNELIKNDFGIFSAPTGFGKTIIATKIITKRKVSTLILTHRKQLATQWIEKIKEFTDFDAGFIGGGKNKPTGKIDVAVMQTLIKKENLEEFLSEYGQLIVDECHHLAAYQFEQIAKKFRGKYVLGLTATYERKDGHHPIIQMQCGEIVCKIKPQKKKFETFVKPVFTYFTCDYDKDNMDINELYDSIINNKARNELIIENIKQELKKQKSCILLSERTEHVNILADLLKDATKNIFVLTGKIKPKEVKAILDKIKEVPKNEELLIIATGKYIGEGFDEARLDTLFLTMPISWKGTLTQYIGRLNRDYENKKEAIIYDFVDVNIPVFEKMYKKRIKTYKTLNCIF